LLSVACSVGFAEFSLAQSVSSGNPEGESSAVTAASLSPNPPSTPILTAQRSVTVSGNTQVDLTVSGLDSGTTPVVLRKALDEAWQVIPLAGSTGQDTAEPDKVYTYVAMARRPVSELLPLGHSLPSALKKVKERSVRLYGSASTWAATYGPGTEPSAPLGSILLQQAGSLPLNFQGPFDELVFIPYPELPFGISIMHFSASREQKTDLLQIGLEASFQGAMDLQYDGGPWGTYIGNWWSVARAEGEGLLVRFDSEVGGQDGVPYEASGQVVFPLVEFYPSATTTEGQGFDSATSPPKPDDSPRRNRRRAPRNNAG